MEKGQFIDDTIYIYTHTYPLREGDCPVRKLWLLPFSGIHICWQTDKSISIESQGSAGIFSAKASPMALWKAPNRRATKNPWLKAAV